MTDLPDVLKVELRIEVNGQPLLIQAQVQGCLLYTSPSPRDS